MTHFLFPLLLAGSLYAAELKPATIEAYEKYVSTVHARMDAAPRFLWADRQPNGLERLKKGEVLIESLKTAEAKVPDGLVHHWVGAVFVPNVTLAKALAMVQDYDHHDRIYKPDVIGSKLIRRDGDDFEVFLRFFKKKVISVVLNTTHEAHYKTLDANRVAGRSRMTRVAEVQDAGKPDGPEKPQGQDHGFLWRLVSDWRFEQRDGGVYIESESISLTRDIPTGTGWLVGPIVNSLPKETLVNTMNSTRAALVK